MAEAASQEPRRVVSWCSYDEAEADGREEAIGGCGGIMRAQSPDEYLEGWKPHAQPYVLAIWSALDELGIITGDEHQSSRCPVFDDGKVATFSMRAWGDLVAAWWNGRHPDAPADYCQFAWYGNLGPVDEAALVEWLRKMEVERRACAALSSPVTRDHIADIMCPVVEERPTTRRERALRRAWNTLRRARVGYPAMRPAGSWAPAAISTSRAKLRAIAAEVRRG